jgi:hypothetical protein
MGTKDLPNDANWITVHAKIRLSAYDVAFMGTPWALLVILSAD